MIHLNYADTATVTELVNSGDIHAAVEHVQKVHGCTTEDAIVAVDQATIEEKPTNRTPPNDGEYDEAFEGNRR